MKQTTLEDLYYGNINPNEMSFVRGSEHGKCFDKATDLPNSVCMQSDNFRRPKDDNGGDCAFC